MALWVTTGWQKASRYLCQSESHYIKRHLPDVVINEQLGQVMQQGHENIKLSVWRNPTLDKQYYNTS